MGKKKFNFLILFSIFIYAVYEIYRNHIYIVSVNEFNSDAFYTYLPAARRFLDDPISFLTVDPLSHYVAPLGYIWPAIFGANEGLIILANCFLFLFGLLFIWMASYRLGGIFAAAISTLFLVVNPSIIYYVPKVLTESLFFFGVAVFIWSLVEIIFCSNKKIAKYAFVFGLIVTLLSRPVLQFIVIFLIVFSSILLVYSSFFGVKSTRIAGKALLLARGVLPLLAISMILPFLFVLKNYYYFDVKSISTGSGIGLYYGVNPMRLGIEPSFMNFTYDIAEVVKKGDPETHGDPFTRSSDRIAALAAMDIVKNTTIIDNFNFFLQKSYYWFLYSTPELNSNYKNRFYRLFSLCLIVFGFGFLLSDVILRRGCSYISSEKLLSAGVLLGLFSLMFAQLTPILYNNRYNAFLLDIWLAVLAGFAVSILLGRFFIFQKGKLFPSINIVNWPGLALIFIAFLVSLGFLSLSSRYERILIDPFRPGPVAVVLDGNSMEVGSRFGLMDLENNNEWQLKEWHAILEISLDSEDLSDSFMDGLWRVRFSVKAPQDQSCRKAWLGLKNAFTEAVQGEKLLPRLMSDDQMHVYAISANDPLRPRGRSILQLRLSCPPGTKLQWGGADLLKSTMPEAVEALVQQEQSINPYFIEMPFVKD